MVRLSPRRGWWAKAVLLAASTPFSDSVDITPLLKSHMLPHILITFTNRPHTTTSAAAHPHVDQVVLRSDTNSSPE